MTNATRDELAEQEKRALQRDAAEGIRSALIEYVRACEKKAPELLAAIEFLGVEIGRLDGGEGVPRPAE